jgi:transposase-like protein
MEKNSIAGAAPSALLAGQAWVDSIESGIHGRVRELVEPELASALGRGRDERGGTSRHRYGHRVRPLTGSFGPVESSVPRARLREPDGTEREWRSAVLLRYAGRSRQMEALIAPAYLSGTTPRRVQRGLAALFRGGGVLGLLERGFACSVA